MKIRIISLKSNNEEVLLGLGLNVFRLKSINLPLNLNYDIIFTNWDWRKITYNSYKLYLVKEWKDHHLMDLGISDISESIKGLTYKSGWDISDLNGSLIGKTFSQDPLIMHGAIKLAKNYLEPIYDIMKSEDSDQSLTDFLTSEEP